MHIFGGFGRILTTVPSLLGSFFLAIPAFLSSHHSSEVFPSWKGTTTSISKSCSLMQRVALTALLSPASRGTILSVKALAVPGMKLRSPEPIMERLVFEEVNLVGEDSSLIGGDSCKRTWYRYPGPVCTATVDCVEPSCVIVISIGDPPMTSLTSDRVIGAEFSWARDVIINCEGRSSPTCPSATPNAKVTITTIGLDTKTNNCKMLNVDLQHDAISSACTTTLGLNFGNCRPSKHFERPYCQPGLGFTAGRDSR